MCSRMTSAGRYGVDYLLTPANRPSIDPVPTGEVDDEELGSPTGSAAAVPDRSSQEGGLDEADGRRQARLGANLSPKEGRPFRASRIVQRLIDRRNQSFRSQSATRDGARPSTRTV